MIKSRFNAVYFAFILQALQSGCALDRQAPIGDPSDDREITARVQALISQYPDLGAPNTIYVETHNHVVHLSGLVNTPFTRADIQNIASRVPGVARVTNSIAVDE